MRKQRNHGRRAFLKRLLGVGAGLAWRSVPGGAPDARSRPVGAAGESLPVIGMGSWITFNVGDDEGARAVRREVLRVFFEQGGRLIDSSPMYGSSEEVIGDCLARIDREQPVFSATKVWTRGRDYGIRQMEDSLQLWGGDRFDLMQVHNLLDWQTHLETLKAWKADGRVRYIGVTTSHGRRHDLLRRVMDTEPLDFVQVTYNIVDREAERYLLPLAAERGIAVIINRPFRGGALFPHLAGRRLPEWVAEIGCENWAQFLLKFIVSHPAVTCAIPATSRPDHMRENMGAGYGPLPDAVTRRRMVRHFAAIRG